MEPEDTRPAAPRPVPVEPLVERYLEHVRVEKRLAARTVELYTLDLCKLSAYAHATAVELAAKPMEPPLGAEAGAPLMGLDTENMPVGVM